MDCPRRAPRQYAVDASVAPEVSRPCELLRTDGGDRFAGPRDHPRPAARFGRHGRGRRCARAVRPSRRVEPRALPGEAPARTVYGRRRAILVGVRDLMADHLHEPVLAAEAIAMLAPGHGGLFVDCTVGL